MPAPISIVIPTLNAEDVLPASLHALMEGLHSGLIRELIISDGGSTDLTAQIADEAGAEIVTGPASRGGQLQRGCEAAKADWLLILHADTVLQDGWSKVVSDHLPIGKPATFRLAFRAHGFGPTWVAGWANLRSRVFGLPYGDQGLLVPRQTYLKAGGYPDQPLMEDVALVRALPAITLLNTRAVTSADRYERVGWVRRGVRNLWTLTRYFLGADPERLARAYRR
ncbi:TIGR04283 family arsenosugar biosynthesis glycosyltransferase [Ruegeria meonggei]|uniref:PGL/p-HBAD biosynthesis glycosyltransferase/MT3031 n=1 Tax=Ruegeria meonggei TaxID=1446476 RepID=A0A1X6YBP1_9RHOB|nr:TIGR04283 family arsenosugar biosynthesis glycosyltransferase [Ruegeria meonggei]SLN15815.1 PGL/p-HBAD biosynthesis glycosyltransferase/MT3031 [Ruegeria meonggei]